MILRPSLLALLAAADSAGTAAAASFAVTEVEGPESVSVRSCHGPSDSSVELAVTYGDLTPPSFGGPPPWLGLSFRTTEECLMTPPGGEDGEVVLVLADEAGEELAPFRYSMPSSTRLSDFEGAAPPAPLGDAAGYSDARVTRGGGAEGSAEGQSVTLRFRRAVNSGGGAPEVMHLTYAVGSTPQFGYHRNRRCFEVRDFPTCDPPAEETEAEEPEADGEVGPPEVSDIPLPHSDASSATAQYVAAGALATHLVISLCLMFAI